MTNGTHTSTTAASINTENAGSTTTPINPHATHQKTKFPVIGTTETKVVILSIKQNVVTTNGTQVSTTSVIKRKATAVSIITLTAAPATVVMTKCNVIGTSTIILVTQNTKKIRVQGSLCPEPFTNSESSPPTPSPNPSASIKIPLPQKI